jgi:HD-GYP domain-containing protein (c-di-GMP phosphodiesterase class II)
VPILVPCDELQPGMRLAEAFFWQDRLMLAGNAVLTVSDINSLQARFPKHSFRVADPLLDTVVEFEDDTYERTVGHVAKRRIADCMAEVGERFNKHASLRDVSVSSIHAAVLDVIKYLADNPVGAALVDNLMSGRGYLSEHAGNVFYLSMLLGTAARDYVAKERTRQSITPNLDPHLAWSLVPLGLGAMLMDLGMLPLQSLFTEKEPLTPEAWRQIRNHPIASAALLSEELSPAAKMIVRTHHENMDGSGYPEGIPGEKLHVFSRIIRIADAYDAATAVRVYKEAKSPARVLWEMSVGPYRRYYDQALIGTFGRLIQPFPIGSKIQLQNGQHAVVVKYNRRNPVAPVVVVAFDAENRRIPEEKLSKPICLGERPELRGASFNGEDLSFIYDTEAQTGNRSGVGIWPSLLQAAYP